MKYKVQTSNNNDERCFGKEISNELYNINKRISSIFDKINKAKINNIIKTENTTINNSNNKVNKSFYFYKSKNDENIPNNITKNNNIQTKNNNIERDNIKPIFIKKNFIDKSNIINKKIKYKKNPLDEYDDSIMKNLFLEEVKNRPNYIQLKSVLSQKDILTRFNAINFIIALSETFNLRQETIYLAINLYDRCIQKFMDYNPIKTFVLSCIFVSSKYEEIYPPLLEEYFEILPFSKSEMFKLENMILSITNFKLHICSPYLFLSKFFHSNSQYESKEIFYLAQFILDLSTISLDFCSFKPSFQAVICLYIARFLFNRKKYGNKLWTAENEFNTGYSELEIKNNLKISLKIIQQFYSGHLIKDSMKSSLFKKYCGNKYLGVANRLKGLL